MITLTSDNFEENVLKNDKPVLIDFWASWCGPCQMQSPIIDEIDKEAEGITVAKVNVDEEPELASKYGIMSIPTILVFKDGICASTNVGLHSKQQLLEIIENLKFKA
ncbi:MAG: thioredoxin [Lachnospiraceae bacterium]|nr:thioredoxin [Lachnospiraceae bacterium]